MTIKIKKSPSYTDARRTRIVAAGNVPVQPLNPTGMADLVAWYKADSLSLSNGATVTSWPDDSPNNNDLNTYESAPIYNASDALLNGMPSVTYDGNDSNYRSNPTGLPVGSSACTTYVVGYWSGAANGDMFTWGSNAYNGARMGVGYYGGMVFENGGIATAQRAVSANTPFIISYPYVAGANTTAAMTYLNGVVATGEYSGLSGVANISNPVAEIVIGRPATAPVERWTGAVAEVLVFNTTHDAITRGRIEKYLSNKYGAPVLGVRSVGSTKTKLVSPTVVLDGLVMHLDAGNPASYPGTGTTWTDLSGHGNNATLTNGPTFDSGNGGSIVFDGVNDYAPTSTNNFPLSYFPGTLSGWAKATSLSGVTSWIFAYGTAAQYQSRFIGRLGSTFYAGGYNDDITYSSVPLDTWFNITVTWDGTYASMYVNGSLVAGPTAKSWNTVSNVSYVGAQTGGAEFWVGNIAQVLVYNRSLSAGEVLQNYNAHKSRYGL